MPMEPRHPDEQALHHELRDALNRELTDTDFFVWIEVEPSGVTNSFDNLAAMVPATEQWLALWNPDAIAAGRSARSIGERANSGRSIRTR